jgi:hypothetical protein
MAERLREELTVIAELVNVVRLESGRTEGACSVCGVTFWSGANHPATAQVEITIFFKYHACKKPRSENPDAS